VTNKTSKPKKGTKMNLFKAVKHHKRKAGSLKSVTEICHAIGVSDPSKATLNSVAKFLRSQGFEEQRSANKRCFYCEDWDLFFEKQRELAKEDNFACL
jgi:hypothetical protein